jgi:hypothetical protein
VLWPYCNVRWTCILLCQFQNSYTGAFRALVSWNVGPERVSPHPTFLQVFIVHALASMNVRPPQAAGKNLRRACVATPLPTFLQVFISGRLNPFVLQVHILQELS